MKKFTLIGASGYIASRHIKETNNSLVAILDKCDSVGIINSYFLKASLFTEFERYIDRLRRDKKTKIDFVSIIILNYLYDSHIRWAKRSGSGGIVINIGVHFYNILIYIFGNVEENIVHIKTPFANGGFLKLEQANVL